MGSYNKRISDQSKIKFDPINRELIDSENSELDAKVESLEENITASKTATGNSITVPDAAPVNAVNLSMDLEPIQAGSGTPSPDNIRPISGRSQVAIQRVGKNLFNVNNYYSKQASISISNNRVSFTNSNYDAVRYSFKVEANKTYTFSYTLSLSSGSSYIGVNYSDLTGIYEEQKNESGTYYFSITPSKDDEILIALCGTSNTSTGYFENCQFELGSTATAYEPYAGKTYTIQIGETVYGGQLDVTKGKMVVDSGYIASYNGETLPSTWISDRDVYASGTTPTIGAEVVYELAEPFTIDLTPTQIKMFENTNTITTDYDGDVLSLEYQPNNAFGELLGEVNNIYDSIIEDIYDKIDSLDTRVTALEE